MLREALFAKIHQAVVTACHPDYSGSLTLDQDLLDATGLLPNEKILVADCENGKRFETYIFAGERGSRAIEVNGAAANLTCAGHRIIVMSFCQLSREELADHRPRVIVCDRENRIIETIDYDPAPMFESAR